MFQSDKQKRNDSRAATISQSVGKKEMKVMEKKKWKKKRKKKCRVFPRFACITIYSRKRENKKLYKLYTKSYTNPTFC